MISDLLEENQDLRKQVSDLEQKGEIERSSRIALVNKIAELEKENTELKKKQFPLRNEQYEKELIDLNDNLTKAKEIICLGLRAIETNGKCNHLFVEQAEQFLKEETE